MLTLKADGQIGKFEFYSFAISLHKSRFSFKWSVVVL